MTSIGEVYFGLYGDNFEPEDVSQFIGLTATKIRKKGERNSNEPIPRNSAWKYSNGKIEADLIDVYQMSEQLVQKLLPYSKKIAEAKDKFDLSCFLQVVIWIDKDESKSMPAIGFDRNVLDFLQLVGGTIDIDTYRH